MEPKLQRISENASRTELRRHQARLSGHRRRRQLRNPGSQRDARSRQRTQKGTQEIPAVRQARRHRFRRQMKTGFVTELLSEQTITTFFLVHEKEVRNTREGRAYLRLELGDRSGTIEARMWEQFEVVAKDINRDDFVKGSGARRGLPQPAATRPGASAPRQARRDRPRRLFAPHAADVEKMWTELLGYAELDLQNPWLKKLVLQIVTDPGTAKCYKRAPAAKVMHHAYLGGLLEHVIGLCGMARHASGALPRARCRSACSPPRMLHDVGKLEELCYERAIGYTTPGQLLGHIVMELGNRNPRHGQNRGLPCAAENRRPAPAHQPSRPIRIRLAQAPHDSRSHGVPLPR